MSAPRRQRAAHEHHIRQGEQAAQFPDGVEQQHAGKRQRAALVQVRAAQAGNAGLVQFARRRIETLRLARHQNQQQARMPRGKGPEGGNYGVVFVHIAGEGGRHGAGGNPHLHRRQALHQRANGRAGRRLAGLEVVLQIARYPHLCRRGAGGQEAFPHGLALHQDGVRLPQHGAEEGAQFDVAGEGAVRNAAVNQEQARPGVLGFAEEVRPDLRLRHHHQRRP